MPCNGAGRRSVGTKKQSKTKSCVVKHGRGVRTQTSIYPRSRAQRTRRVDLDTYASGRKGRQVRNRKRRVFRCSHRFAQHTSKHARPSVHEGVGMYLQTKQVLWVACYSKGQPAHQGRKQRRPHDGARGMAQVQGRSHSPPWPTLQQKKETRNGTQRRNPLLSIGEV